MFVVGSHFFLSTQDKSTYNNHTRLQHKSYKPYTCMISIRSITRVKEKSCNIGTSSVDGFRNPRRQDHPACNAASIFSSSTTINMYLWSYTSAITMLLSKGSIKHRLLIPGRLDQLLIDPILDHLQYKRCQLCWIFLKLIEMNPKSQTILYIWETT